jgi:hypothetical protein
MFNNLDECQKLLADIKAISINPELGAHIDDIQAFINKAREIPKDQFEQVMGTVIEAIHAKFIFVRDYLQKAALNMTDQTHVARIGKAIEKINNFPFINSIDILLKDSTSYMLTFLDYKSLVNFSLTSKKYNQLANDESLWKKQCELHEIDIQQKEEQQSYKRLFAVNIDKAQNNSCFLFVAHLRNPNNNADIDVELVKRRIIFYLRMASANVTSERSLIYATAAEKDNCMRFETTYNDTCTAEFAFGKDELINILKKYSVNRDDKVLEKVFERSVVIRDKFDQQIFATPAAGKTHEDNVENTKKDNCLVM